jgi:hypothetical protein
MSAKRPKGTKNTAAANKYEVATQLSVTASRENRLPIEGKAILTEELVNGVRNELNEAIKRITPFEVPKAAPLFSFGYSITSKYYIIQESGVQETAYFSKPFHAFSLFESSAVHHVNGWLVKN